MKLVFRKCCVCGKTGDERLMDKAFLSVTGVALSLTLKAPNETHVHPKCAQKMKKMLSLIDEANRSLAQKIAKDDLFHRGV